MISIVLAEDQGMILGALASLLDLEEGLSVVGRAANGVEALALVRKLKPDILVADIEMPGMSGLDVAAAIQRDRLPTRVLIVTTFGRSGYLRRAMDAGVRGYLLKDAPSAELAAAVRPDAWNGAQLSLRSFPEAGSEQSHRSRSDRPRPRLALTSSKSE